MNLIKNDLLIAASTLLEQQTLITPPCYTCHMNFITLSGDLMCGQYWTCPLLVTFATLCGDVNYIRYFTFYHDLN